MKKAFSILIIGLSCCWFEVAYAQLDPSCSCKKFPYWYCLEGVGEHFTFCMDDPYNLNDSVMKLYTTGKGPIAPIRAPRIPGCIRMFRTDISDYGYVWDDSGAHPSFNLDTGAVTKREQSSEGWTFQHYILNLNYLEAKWGENLGWLGAGGCTIKADSSCCVTVYFQSDPDWWQRRDVNPATGGLAYTEWNYDHNDCTIPCSGNTTNINVTPNFFYDSDTIPADSNLPDHLNRGFIVNQNGQDKFPLYGSFTTGGWIDSLGEWHGSVTNMHAAYDFITVILHEMGHIIGLPDRGDSTALNGPCGNYDKNSLMSPIPNGVSRQEFRSDNDDNCWITKLYCPGAVPPCPQTHPLGVSSMEDDFELVLEQSRPNPSTGEAIIEFSTNASIRYSLEIYDLLGNTVISLGQKQMASPGDYMVKVPGNLPSGKYIYSLRAGGKVLSKEMTIIK